MVDPSRERADSGEISPLGSVVVLLGDSHSRLSAETAIDLCSELAASGQRMVLADLHLETPLLHELLGVENLEGLVDIFLYGASLSRIARPVLDSAFLFIPAGTYPPDPAEVYSNDRWKKLVAGFAESDATLAVFTPAEGDLAALAHWSTDVVLLGPARDEEQVAELERLGFRVHELHPSAHEAEAPATLPEAEATIWPPTPHNAIPAPHSTPELIRLPESELELPPPPVRTPAKRSAGSPVLWILLAAVAIATIAYLLFSLKPELLPGAAAESLTSVGAVDDTIAASATAVSGAVPYSVPVRAFSSLAAAQEEVAANQLRLPSIPFYVSAETQQEVLYYRVFAGTSPDSATAEVLRRDLVREDIINEADSGGSWSFIERTPLAFDLGQFASMSDAAERLDSLRARAIPAYATLIPYSDGSRRWQLYGGAFRDSLSGEGMRDLLTTVGVEPRLTVRSGSRRSSQPDAATE